MDKRVSLHCAISLLAAYSVSYIQAAFLAFFCFSTLLCAQSPADDSNGQSKNSSPVEKGAAVVNGAKNGNTEPGSEKANNQEKKNNNNENGDKNNNNNKNGNGDKNNNKNGNDKKGNGKPKKSPLIFTDEDSEFKFGIKLRLPEFFYGKNLRLINDENPTDRVIYFRHIIDLTTEYRFGRPTTKYDIIYAKMTMRNKGVWGDPESIASTTLAPIRELDAVFGEHRHGIPRHILWIRELWIQLSLSDLLCIPFCNQHWLTLGAFPFELGRGIALGAAYALDPSDLGFYTEVAIDQYAFGGKLSGDIIKDRLAYDLYGAILNNLSDTFDNTNQKIRGQQFFHREDQARGFGIINYVVAARLIWTPRFTNPKTMMRVEPYALYNHNPEQKIEFVGDAKSDLFTMGIAGEFEFGNFECGFDTAFNFGHQKVFGWDRNFIKLENRDGTVVVVNSHVRQGPGQHPNPRKAPLALKIEANQNIINQSAQAAEQNGKVIGMNAHGTLVNGIHRFTEPSINKYRGSMIVYDMGYNICKPEFKVCAGFGYASGDRNPNRDLQFVGDSDVHQIYEGFIGLQEAYGGTRIKSAFLLSGQGRIPRPLSFPTEEVFDPFAVVVNRFTNLVFAGASAYWRPSWSCKRWSFNPNIIAFWTDFQTRFFDRHRAFRRHHHDEKPKILHPHEGFARNFLGVEVNAFAEAELITDLKFFLVGSVFFPGGHYEDLEGRPLNKAQRAFLDNLDVTGIINDRVPLLGHDKAYFINLGLEYRY